MKFLRRLALVALLGALSSPSFSQAQFVPQAVDFGVHPGCDAVSFSRDGRVLMTRDGTAFPSAKPQFRIWDVASHRLLRTISGGLLERISGDGARFLVLNTRTTESIGFIESVLPSSPRVALKWSASKSDDFFDADWSKDGKEIWLLSSQKLLCFNASTGALLSSRARDSHRYEWLQGDGEHLLGLAASTPESKEASLIQLDIPTLTNKVLSPRIPDEFSIDRLSGDAQFYWVNTPEQNTGSQQFFRVRDNTLLWTWKGHGSTSACCSDGRVISFDNKRDLCLGRDTQTGHPLWQFVGPRPLAFTLSPDGKTLAEARRDGHIALWPLPSSS